MNALRGIYGVRTHRKVPRSHELRSKLPILMGPVKTPLPFCVRYSPRGLAIYHIGGTAYEFPGGDSLPFSSLWRTSLITAAKYIMGSLPAAIPSDMLPRRARALSFVFPRQSGSSTDGRPGSSS